MKKKLTWQIRDAHGTLPLIGCYSCHLNCENALKCLNKIIKKFTVVTKIVAVPVK